MAIGGGWWSAGTGRDDRRRLTDGAQGRRGEEWPDCMADHGGPESCQMVGATGGEQQGPG